MRCGIKKSTATLAIICALFISCATASSTPGLSSLSLPKTLPADQAFTFSLTKEASLLKLEWQIAPGCYLYQDKLAVTLIKNKEKIPLLMPDKLPVAETISDPYFGAQAIYNESLTIPISLASFIKDNTTSLFLNVHYQGCSESGFCYPPIKKYFEIKIVHHNISQIYPIESLEDSALITSHTLPSSVSHVEIPKAASKQHFLTTLATFYLLGILLAFTPCVLPMIPILFGVIVGQKHLNTQKAFWLSLSYVVSMAFTYAIVGILVALLGKNLQAWMQQPPLIISFAILFALLALLQMGFIKINLPPHLQLNKLLTALHMKQESGTYFGAAVMGILATFISSSCVTIPLLGALTFISRDGNVLLGGSALLAMGLGMGTILLLIGTIGGKYIPRSGPWMHTVNHAFAVIMFGLSLWLLEKCCHGPWLLTLWGILCLFIAWCMDTFRHKASWPSRIGMLFVLYAGILFWGAAQGEREVLKPLHNPWSTFPTETPVVFETVYSPSALNSLLEKAKQQSQPIVLVYYATWCANCQHMEHTLFANAKIKEKLLNYKLIRADVSAYHQASKDLLKKFDLIGPPALLFFDKNGKELSQYRLIGEISAKSFVATLEEVRGEMKE